MAVPPVFRLACWRAPVKEAAEDVRTADPSRAKGRRIGSIQLFQELNEVLALMRLADDLGDGATVQIQTRQQRNGSQSLVFVVPGRAGMVPGQGRPVGRFLRQRLNA